MNELYNSYYSHKFSIIILLYFLFCIACKFWSSCAIFFHFFLPLMSFSVWSASVSWAAPPCRWLAETWAWSEAGRAGGSGICLHGRGAAADVTKTRLKEIIIILFICVIYPSFHLSWLSVQSFSNFFLNIIHNSFTGEKGNRKYCIYYLNKWLDIYTRVCLYLSRSSCLINKMKKSTKFNTMLSKGSDTLSSIQQFLKYLVIIV